MWVIEADGVAGIEAGGVGFGVIEMVRLKSSIPVTAVPSIEDVVGYGDQENVDDEHVDESTRVNAGSEEGWYTNYWERSG